MGDETISQGGEPVAVDDALAARLRSSIDGDAAPVTFEEIRRRADVPTPDVGTETGTDPEIGSGDGGPATSGSGASARSEPARWRPLAWLGAAAAVVLLVGIGALVATRPSGDAGDDLDVTSGPGTTTLATTPPTSIVIVEPAPGGLYDPVSTILAHRQVLAMATDDAGRLYVSYSHVGGQSGVEPVPEHGILVADAADGSVTAEHLLPEASPAIALSGSTLWLIVGDPSTGMQLWRAVDGAAPEQVDALPASDLPAAIAASEDSVWVRSLGRLQQRDATTGAVFEDSTDPAFAGAGAIAADGGGGWTVGPGRPERFPGAAPSILVPFDGVEGGPVIGGASIGPVAMVDETLIAAVDGTALTVMLPESQTTVVAESDHTIQGIDGRGGRVWAVTNDLASSVDVGVVTFELGGEPRWIELGVEGLAPTVAAIDEHHAFVCALFAGAGEPPISVGSACRLLDARTSPDEVPTSTPETTPTTVALPTATTSMPAVTTTTSPPFPEVPTTTTTIAARPLNPAGISSAGLDPVTLALELEPFLASTTEPFRRANPQCGHEVYLDSTGGVEVHLYPIVEGDGSSGNRWWVGAIAVKISAFSTAAGARVGMSTAQLQATVPGLEHSAGVPTLGGPKDPGQYAERTSRGTIFYDHADGVVTRIVVSTYHSGFLQDLC